MVKKRVVEVGDDSKIARIGAYLYPMSHEYSLSRVNPFSTPSDSAHEHTVMSRIAGALSEPRRRLPRVM